MAASKATEAQVEVEVTALALAKQVGQAMYQADTATKDTMGITLIACAPGRAVMQMQVKPLHLNGHQICHGGFIFTLCDSTFAFACNSHNKNTVAAGCSIDYLKPVQLGDVLTAEGIEQTLSGRHGIYDVCVRNQHGDTVAMFRGKSAQIAGTVIQVSPSSS